MTDRLRGLTFRRPAINFGVADSPEGRFALALVFSGGAEDHGDDVLEYDLAGCDLSLARSGRAPVLLEHRWSIDFTLGGIADAWIEDGALHCLLRFASGDAANPAWRLLAEGFPVNISMGAEILESVPAGPSAHGGTVYRVTVWRLAEVSVVAKGRDQAAHGRRLDHADLSQLAERVRKAEDATRLEVRRRLQLDRWDRWALAAGVRLAQELGVDLDRLGDALAREVKEHAAALERDNAAPRLSERAA